MRARPVPAWKLIASDLAPLVVGFGLGVIIALALR
jgi:hypothetical protein